jgi:hypothetical protein
MNTNRPVLDTAHQWRTPGPAYGLNGPYTLISSSSRTLSTHSISQLRWFWVAY